MPPRLNKRQQRELEELDALNHSPITAQEDPGSDTDTEPAPAPVIKSAGFAALLSPEDNGPSEEEENTVLTSSKKSKKKKKKSPGTGTKSQPDSEAASRVDTPTRDPQPQGLSKAEHKAAKKVKQKIAKAEISNTDDIDVALAELSLKHPLLKTAQAASGISGETRLFANLLSVSLSNLDAEAEMRKFFGSKVVNASKVSTSSPGPSRRQGAMNKSYLTRPHPTWWQTKSREGLSMRPLTEVETGEKVGNTGDKWWTVEYSNKYKSTTKRFMQTVASGNPDGFFDLLHTQPWHGDTLLQLAEVYRHREDYSQAVDFTERTLFTYERSYLGTGFSLTTGTSRLDFDFVENRPFFLALHRHAVDLQRRGTPRTAFEFLRFLYSLDPWTDPHASLLHLDYAAIKGGMKDWLLETYDFFDSSAYRSEDSGGKTPQRMNPSLLPGWNYSRALALFLQEQESKGSHEKSSEALKDAFSKFPQMLIILGDKAEISIPEDIRRHPACKLVTDRGGLREEQAITHLLCHLYAQRAASLWKEPATATWFRETLVSFSSKLQPTTFSSVCPTHRLFGTSTTPGFFGGAETPNILRLSVYRHCITQQDAPNMRRFLGFIPPSITARSGMACDPLPPPTAKTAYDDEFFKGVKDDLEGVSRRLTRRQREGEERMLAQMVPDVNFRRQMQMIYDRMADRFPGGILQFAEAMQHLPEDALTDMLVAVNEEQHIQGNDRMPGGFGEERDRGAGNLVVFPDPENLPEPPLDLEDEESDEEEEEEVQAVAPLPIRLIRNIVGLVFGAGRGHDDEDDEDVDEDEDEENDPLDPAGVD